MLDTTRLIKAIQTLRDEKNLIDRVIETLQPQPKRRGRKFMSPEERQQVAIRMKNYWRKRRVHEPAGRCASRTE